MWVQDDKQKEYNKAIDNIDQLTHALDFKYNEIVKTEIYCYQGKWKTNNIKQGWNLQENKNNYVNN